MTLLDAVLIAVAGGAAGAINAVVGSGTLITFPTLLALGYPPVLANVSNTVGLAPGSFAGAVGYRRELRGQTRRLAAFVPASLLGGITGAALLLTLPESAFRAIVPALIGLAVVLVLIQPWLTRRLPRPATLAGPAYAGLIVGIFLTGVYGGYFGAAQGVLLLAVMGLVLPDPLQSINAVKNVLAGVVNLIAAVFFIVVSDDVDWRVAGLIAAGSIVGGFAGAAVGRRLPASVLRAVIVVVGTIAFVALLVT